MPSIKYVLQQPYTKGFVDEIKDYKKAGNDLDKMPQKLLNSNETRIYMMVTIDRDNRFKTKTEFQVLPKNWSFKNQLLKTQIAGSTEFNQHLLELKTKVLNKYTEILKENPGLSFFELKRILTDFINKKELPTLKGGKSIFHYFDLFLDYQTEHYSPRTVQKFKTTKNSLLDFAKKEKEYNNLVFSQINHIFLNKYIKYLRQLPPRGRQKKRPEKMQRGLLNDTVAKYLETLKNFMKWAEKRNYHNYTDYKEFTLAGSKNKQNQSKKKANIITLRVDELQAMYNHDFSNNKRLERVRDVFCFSAYTGQRWSDVECFDKNDLHGDVWIFEAYKTKKQTEIDLIGFAAPALEILKKYDYELPKISSQKFNNYLKEVGKICGIDTPVKYRRYIGAKEIVTEKPKYEFMSSHMGRRSCVSILLNSYNISTSHIMEITGHTKLETLQKYINTDRTARRQAMEKTANAFMNVVKNGTDG